MKTTIDIADAILAEAKRRAARDKTTVRALVERGLRIVLRERRRPGEFRLRDASVEGRGTQPGVSEHDWAELRGLTYAGRGG